MAAANQKVIYALGIVLLMLFIFVSGIPFVWHRVQNESLLHGSFSVKYDIAHERLTLKSDGTFRQEVYFHTGEPAATAKGAWEYDLKDGEVVFDHNYLIVLNGLGEFNPNYLIERKGRVILPVTSRFGYVRIEVYEGVYYEKE